MHIDLNCDMGESFGRYTLGDDAAMLDVVTSANIACGLHAGDPEVMRHTVALAAARQVAIGAHPGYPDLQGFGRRAMALSPEELEASLIYQLGALAGFAVVSGVPLVHVKPHGALYNTAARDDVTAMAVARAVISFDPTLILVTLPGSMLAAAATSLGLRVAHEGFADRAYQDNGALVPRERPGAVLDDPETVGARAVRMVTEGLVTTITGKTIPLRLDTLCIHGDTPNAPQIARDLRQVLEQAGVEVRSLRRGA
jgi:5-oxoprolinase (ATP-hydrolysing) subunit A